MIKTVSSDKVPAAIGPYAQAIKVENMVYTSGQIPMTAEGELIEGDIKEQARQVLVNLQNLLEDSNSSLAQVIKTTIYLTNMDDFISVNTVYAEFFVGRFPARSTVAVKSLPKGVDIEIDAIAMLNDKLYTF